MGHGIVGRGQRASRREGLEFAVNVARDHCRSAAVPGGIRSLTRTRDRVISAIVLSDPTGLVLTMFECTYELKCQCGGEGRGGDRRLCPS